jgi:hypothetical protein
MGADLAVTISPILQQVLAPLIGEGNVLVPAVFVTVQPATSEYRGLVLGERHYLLQQRAGTALDTHDWFSGAPLDSRDHLAYLTQFDELIVAAQARPN